MNQKITDIMVGPDSHPWVTSLEDWIYSNAGEFHPKLYKIKGKIKKKYFEKNYSSIVSKPYLRL